jgi:hypothetical protein
VTDQCEHIDAEDNVGKNVNTEKNLVDQEQPPDIENEEVIFS